MSNPYAPPEGGPDAARERAERERAERERAEQERAAREQATRPSSPGGRDTKPGKGLRPDGTPLDPDEVKAATRRVMHFGLLLLASLITASLPLPWQAAGVVFGITSVVVGILALRASWRAGLRGSALVPMVAIGLVFAFLMTVSLGALLAVWPLQLERQNCLRDALTISAEDACEQEFQDGLTARLNGR